MVAVAVVSALPCLATLSNIPKGAYDPREYHAFELPNRIRALAVSDTQSTFAACAVAVGVGSMSDPPEFPGLAHFLEHMIFLGSAKYPTEDEYNRWVSEHNGYANAYTASEMTNYYFQVDAEALNGTIDRLASLFADPLLLESGVDREVQAVNNEHEKNLRSDAWREWQLMKSLALESSPVNSFSTGNSATLGKPTVRAALQQFHQTKYSSNLMTVAVVGPQPLQELRQYVTAAFSGVPDQRIDAPSWPPPAFPPTIRGVWVTQRPVEPQRTLKVVWIYDDWDLIDPETRAHVERVVSFWLGHEAKGTALSALRQLAWADSLSGGDYSTWLQQPTRIFAVSISLTAEGARHVSDVVALVCAAVRTIAGRLAEGGDAAAELFDGANATSGLSFAFQSKGTPADTAANLAEAMQLAPTPADYLGPPERWLWRADLLAKMLAVLVPERATVHFMDPDAAADATPMHEAVYGTEYGVRNATTDELQLWGGNLTAASEKLKTAVAGLRVPVKNEFMVSVPEATAAAAPPPSTSGSEVVAAAPTLLRNDSGIVVWHKPSMFDQPKAEVTLRFSAARRQLTSVKESARRAALRQVYDATVALALSDVGYSAQLGLMSYSVTMGLEHLTITLGGLSLRQPELLASVAARVADPSAADSSVFSVAHEQASLAAERALLSPNPYTLALAQMSEMLSEAPSLAAVAAAVKDVTATELRALASEYLRDPAVEMVVVGNLADPAAQVNRLLAAIEPLGVTGQASPPIRQRWEEERLGGGSSGLATRVPAGWSVLASRQQSPDNDNSAVWSVYQMHPAGTVSVNEVYLQLLGLAVSAPFFSQLRTKEQLGYIVSAGARTYSDMRYLRVILQDSQRTPPFLDQRAEAFLRAFADADQMTSADAFEALREQYAKELVQLPQNIGEEAARVIAEQAGHWYRWTRVADLTGVLRSPDVNVTGFRRWYLDSVVSASQRHKVSSHIFSHRHAADGKFTAVDPSAVPAFAAANDTCRSLHAEGLRRNGSEYRSGDLAPSITAAGGRVQVSAAASGDGFVERLVVIDAAGVAVAAAEFGPADADPQFSFEAPPSAATLTPVALHSRAGYHAGAPLLVQAGNGSDSCVIPKCDARDGVPLCRSDDACAGGTDGCCGKAADCGEAAMVAAEAARRGQSYTAAQPGSVLERKHRPEITVRAGGLATVTVGEGTVSGDAATVHPSVPSGDPNVVHYVELIYVLDNETADVVAYGRLSPTAPASLDFRVPPSARLLTAYALCNVHGLYHGGAVEVPATADAANTCEPAACLSLPPPVGSADVTAVRSADAFRVASGLWSGAAEPPTPVPAQQRRGKLHEGLALGLAVGAAVLLVVAAAFHVPRWGRCRGRRCRSSDDGSPKSAAEAILEGRRQELRHRV